MTDTSWQDLIALTALSPLDGRYRSKVAPLAKYCSEAALIKTRIEVEALYLVALSKTDVVRSLSSSEIQQLQQLADSLSLAQIEQVKDLEQTTRHDVKAVERAMRDWLGQTGLADVIEMLHFGLTSEDINNLAHRLMLKRALDEIILPELQKVINVFAELAVTHADLPMLARTHGQAAVPTTLGKEMANIAARLETQRAKLATIKLTGKLNGAVGNYNALVLAAPEVDWVSFSEQFVTSLGLQPNPLTTQINYADDMIEVFQILQRINAIIINIDTDMWRYISDDWFVQEIKAGEVGSSTMPQKVNPIDFENSKGNAEVANSLWEGLARQLAISWLQRDLSGSTVVRNIGAGLGYSLLAYQSLHTGMQRVRPNQTVITSALNENWAILTEGVQTVLRRAGVADPYSQIATLTRGQKISQADWEAWVQELKIDAALKTQLLQLSPATYIGLAATLAATAANAKKS